MIISIDLDVSEILGDMVFESEGALYLKEELKIEIKEEFKKKILKEVITSKIMNDIWNTLSSDYWKLIKEVAEIQKKRIEKESTEYLLSDLSIQMWKNWSTTLSQNLYDKLAKDSTFLKSLVQELNKKNEQ